MIELWLIASAMHSPQPRECGYIVAMEPRQQKPQVCYYKGRVCYVYLDKILCEAVGWNEPK